MIQYISIINYPIENATSYELLEMMENGDYEPVSAAEFTTEGRVNLTNLELSKGEHKFVVQAHSDNLDYEDSKYSNLISYSVSTDSGTEIPGEGEGGNTDDGGNEGEDTVIITVNMDTDLATIDEDSSNLHVGDNEVKINQECILKATLNKPGDYKFDNVIARDTEGNELPSDETISGSSNEFLEFKYTPDRNCSIQIVIKEESDSPK